MASASAAGGQTAEKRIFFAPEAMQREFPFVEPLGSKHYLNSSVPLANKATKPFNERISLNNGRKNSLLEEYLTATPQHYRNAYRRSVASLEAGENVVPRYNFSPKRKAEQEKLKQAIFTIQKYLHHQEAKKANLESRGLTYSIPNEASVRNSYSKLITKLRKYGDVMAQAAVDQGALNELAAQQIAAEAENLQTYSAPGLSSASANNNLYSGGRRKLTRKSRGKKRKTMKRR